MARGRVYKSEVQAARDQLLRQGTNPSLDAVRIALGNTGSKTTIHRLMKELEAEEAGEDAIAGEAISDALQALVTQLAGQLRQEAEATVAAGQDRAEAQIAAAQADVGRLSEQAREASEQIQRVQAALDDTRQRLAATEQTLRDRDTTIAGLHERTAGLERQLTERESHLASIEVKHQQARDALEHFRLASKEQREVEARQHEQAVQALQVELRRATESVAAKNDELLTLNRDNARLTEQSGRQDKELRDARRDLHTALERAAELDATRQRSESMERRAADALAKLETARSELADMEARHAAERLAYSDALRDAQAQSERLVSIESMLSALQLPPASAEKNADGVEAIKQ